MSLWVSWEIDILPEDQMTWEELFEAVVQQSLREENISLPVEVSLTVTGPEQIQEMNRDFRGIDRVTDVLSFPQVDFFEEDPMKDLVNAERNPDTDEVCLGDIVICMDRAREQAEEFGHSLRRELGFLTAHSMLHLLGYDHMVPEEEKVMFEKQEIILEAIGLSRK